MRLLLHGAIGDTNLALYQNTQFDSRSFSVTESFGWSTVIHSTVVSRPFHTTATYNQIHSHT